MQMNEYLPEDIPEDVDLKYVCGSCMYLAAALYRVTGWPISVALCDNTPEAYIDHAWVSDAPSLMMFDINGVYPESRNSFIFNETVTLTGLTERELLDLTRKTSGHTITQSDWDANVVGALKVAEQYFKPQIEQAAAYKKLSSAPRAKPRHDHTSQPGM